MSRGCRDFASIVKPPGRSAGTWGPTREARPITRPRRSERFERNETTAPSREAGSGRFDGTEEKKGDVASVGFNQRTGFRQLIDKVCGIRRPTSVGVFGQRSRTRLVAVNP